MVKIKKLKRKKTYKYNVNRKRMKNRMKKRPAITCEQMKGEWDTRKSAKENLRQMGLTLDVNATIKIPTDRPAELTVVNSLPDATKTHVAMELEADAKAPRKKNFRLPNGQVFWLTKLIDKYGEDYQETEPGHNERCLPLPRISDTLDSLDGAKYFSTLDAASGYWQVEVEEDSRVKTAFTTWDGLYEFKAMTRDRKMNAFQETWKQLRQKIKTFKNIPEQWNEYLEKKEKEQEAEMPPV